MEFADTFSTYERVEDNVKQARRLAGATCTFIGPLGLPSDTFQKHDSGKPNLAILFDHPHALAAIAESLQYGADKYDRGNWSLCQDPERYEAACLRHMLAYHNGEYIDPESGKPHLALATCSLLFLLELTHDKYQ